MAGSLRPQVRKGDTISKADAHHVLLAILAEEVQRRPVDAKFGQIAIHVLEAAYSFVFNAGPGALKWKWAQAIMRGDLRGAAALWRVTATTAKGKKLPGLIRRRAEEADIAEFDKWPEWVVGTDKPPETHVEAIDIRQAQQWLNQLGYDCGDPDGIAGLRTVTATKRFQTDHGTLRVDGIIGPATLAALQRAIDLKVKGKVVIGGGGAVTGAGGLEQGTGSVDAAAPDAGELHLCKPVARPFPRAQFHPSGRCAELLVLGSGAGYWRQRARGHQHRLLV